MPSSVTSTTPNGELTWATTIVAAAPERCVLGGERREVDVEQLVAVQRQHRARLAPARGREPQPAAAPERLRLADRVDLGAEARERVHEDVLLPRAARDDDPRDAGADEPRDRVLGERIAGDRHERLRQPLGRLPEALGLSAGEQQGLHHVCSVPFGVERPGRPIAS